MPHIDIQYTQDLDRVFDIKAMVTHAHMCLAKDDTVQLASIKSRATALQHYVVGDPTTDPQSMICVVIKVLNGRAPDVLTRMGRSVQFCIQDLLVEKSLAFPVTVEVVEMDSETYFK